MRLGWQVRRRSSNGDELGRYNAFDPVNAHPYFSVHFWFVLYLCLYALLARH